MKKFVLSSHFVHSFIPRLTHPSTNSPKVEFCGYRQVLRSSYCSPPRGYHSSFSYGTYTTPPAFPFFLSQESAPRRACFHASTQNGLLYTALVVHRTPTARPFLTHTRLTASASASAFFSCSLRLSCSKWASRTLQQHYWMSWTLVD